MLQNGLCFPCVPHQLSFRFISFHLFFSDAKVETHQDPDWWHPNMDTTLFQLTKVGMPLFFIVQQGGKDIEKTLLNITKMVSFNSPNISKCFKNGFKSSLKFLLVEIPDIFGILDIHLADWPSEASVFFRPRQLIQECHLVHLLVE